MTRAEEEALKAYPREYDTWCEHNVDRRIGYKHGYHQAEQDLIKMAVLYIQQNWIWNTKIIEDFKNYMEGK